MPLRTLIVDDEPPARDELAYLLSAFEDVAPPAQAASAREAVEIIHDDQPDLVFLDIEMPGGSGFDVVAACIELDPQPLYVFATAFEHYAIQAFEENAVDYLLKPVTEERLAKSLARAREALGRRRKGEGPGAIQRLVSGPLARGITRVPVERGGRIALLKPAEVVFCSTEERKVMVHTREEAWPCHGVGTLDGLEERMAAHAFFRAGRGALVNLARIREFSPWFNGKYVLVMDDAQGTEITISRGRVPLFKEQLGL